MLKNYLVMAFAVMMRRKFFTFASLFGICFTLVVLMVAASVLDHMLVAAPPESELGRMLYIVRARMQGEDSVWTSGPGYKFLDEHVRGLPHTERISFSTGGSKLATYRDGAKILLHSKRTDGEFWKILDFTFVEGVPFTEDDNLSGNHVAVISERTRARLFDGQPAVGRELTADGQTFRVVGVVRDVSYMRHVPFAEVWLPISTFKTQAYRDEIVGNFQAVILANTSGDRAAIKAELQSRLPDVQLPYPEEYDELIVYANTLFEQLSSEMAWSDDERPRPGLLAAAAGVAALLFMLLPSLNLVNLNLSRALERSSEIGVRRAFGAPSRALLGQFLVENVILSLVGGLLGLLLSGWVLGRLNNADLAPYLNLTLNWRVFLWGMLLAVVFGVVSGVLPAWRMSRLHPVEALRARSKL